MVPLRRGALLDPKSNQRIDPQRALRIKAEHLLSIEAKIVGSSLVATWSGEENGRTEYTVIDANTVEVADYVRANGQYHLFAKARYRRIE